MPARSTPDDSPAPPSVVEGVLFSLRPKLNVCYRRATREDAGLRGNAVLKVSFGADGHVTEVVTDSQTGLDASMMACVTAVFQGATFPPPPDGKPSSVKVPLAFQPPRDAGP